MAGPLKTCTEFHFRHRGVWHLMERKWGRMASGGARDWESALLRHRIGSAFGTRGYRSHGIWKLKSSFPGTWADIPRQPALIPTSAKQLPFLLPSWRVPSTWPCSPLPGDPTGFQSGLGDEAPGSLSFLCEMPWNINILNSIIQTWNHFSSRKYGHMICIQVSVTPKKNSHDKIFWRKHIPGFPLAFISTRSSSVLPTVLTSRQVVAGTQSLKTVY